MVAPARRTDNFVRVAVAMLALFAGATAPGCGRHQPPAPAPAAPEPLPALALSAADASAVTRIDLSQPDDDDPTRRTQIVLERRGDAWHLTRPLRGRASADKVGQLLANLQDLRIWKRLDAGTAFYERYDLTVAKALHVVASVEGRSVVDFFAGKSSEQGQLIRLPGTPGLFALANGGPHGYQGFLYSRDLRSWREPALLSFDPGDVESVEIVNLHGAFTFSRRDGSWACVFAPRRRDGRLGLARPWPRLDARRVDEMLQAYRALAADDFAEGIDGRFAGVAAAERQGGVVRVRLLHPPQPPALRVGGPAPTRSRFALAGGRWAALGEAEADDTDDGTVYVLSPWTARWATGDGQLFAHAR